MTATIGEERLTLQAATDVRPVRHAVTRIAGNLPFDSRQVSEIALAVSEACMNGVRHGSTSRYGTLVTVTTRLAEDHLAIEVEDCGSGFAVEPPVMPDPMSETGRGIALMHALMDHVAITSGEDGTRVRMVKYFGTACTCVVSG